MEPNRSYHNPVVEIFGNLITPGVRYSAEAYDLANRRWYRLDATSPDVPDDDWLSATVAGHIKAYHTIHGREASPPWNTIILPTHSDGGGPATFESRRDDLVSRPIRKSLSHGGASPTNRAQLPTTSTNELQHLAYISRAADRCVWRGRDCVFKRIEFDVDVAGIAAEIRAREGLRAAILSSSSSLLSASAVAGLDLDLDLDAEMMRQFCVVPVLAVVIGDGAPWECGTVAGVLMPFCGKDLEMLARLEVGEGFLVTVRQLAEVVRGVRRLGEVGVMHGDIKYWNTVLWQRKGVDEEAKLVLIDLGTVAPGYEGDAKALGTLLLWCVENGKGLKEEAVMKARVVTAASALKAEEDFDAALACFS